jgi:hypothetical protein
MLTYGDSLGWFFLAAVVALLGVCFWADYTHGGPRGR